MSALIKNLVAGVASYPYQVIGGVGAIGAMFTMCGFFTRSFQISDQFHAACFNGTLTPAPLSDWCISLHNQAVNAGNFALVSLCATAVFTGIALLGPTRVEATESEKQRIVVRISVEGWDQA